jgi:ATP-dependent DNA helicase DinG
MISINDWKKYFPFSDIRKQQEEAINFALNAFIADDKRFVVLELSTGVGKSAVGLTISRYMHDYYNHDMRRNSDIYTPGAHILTTQKVLQGQYELDFGKSKLNLLSSVKSSSNYTCLSVPTQKCSETKRILNVLAGRKNGSFSSFRDCLKSCPYTHDKKTFVEGLFGVTNFSYFLSETTYVGKILPKDVLVIDEAHNIESELSNFIELSFSEKFCIEILDCEFPKMKKASSEISQIFKWINKVYKKKLNLKISELKMQIEVAMSENLDIDSLSKQYEKLDKHICKVYRFIEKFDEDNWIVNTEITKTGKKQYRKFNFKPILVKDETNDYLFKFGKHVLLMSATIVDKPVYCRSIGLKESEIAYMSIPSPFPVDNKKIHYMPAGSMSKNNIDNTLPKMTKVIELLINQHQNDKGIIHCTTYKIAKYLYESVKTNRFMIHDSENRDDVLKSHVLSKRPTILLSPSMTEGVDLKDDLSRFQIICKVPFPFLGDMVIKKRMENDKAWYDYQTAKTIIQAIGRSIRNENDYAETYIIDSDWESYFFRNSKMFPIDFKKSLNW